MIEYPKIETLFDRDPDTFKVIPGKYRLPEFSNVRRWLVTEKIHGTNIRIGWDEGKRTIGGRTDNAQIPTLLLSKLEELFPVERLQEVFPEGGVTLFGEGYGPKIQKGGGNYRSDPGFILFDVYIAGWWLEWGNVVDVAEKLGIDVVPVLEPECSLEKCIHHGQEFTRSTFGSFQPEGIVARANPMLLSRTGKRMVFKLKHKDFGR